MSLRCFVSGCSVGILLAGLSCNSLTGADDIDIVGCAPNDTECEMTGAGGSSSGAGGSLGGPGGSSAGEGGASGNLGGAAGQGVGGSLPVVPNVPGSIGAPCGGGTPCAPGRTCLNPASNLPAAGGPPGGPQGGYCSAPCTTAADCTALDPASDCDLGSGYCLAVCDSHSDDCLGLAAACSVFGTPAVTNSPARGACVPVCGADEFCEGRFCNFGTGLCQDAAPSGASFGAACLLDSDCAGGLCLALGAARWCTGGCKLGGIAGACGYSTNSALPPATQRESGCIDMNPYAGSGDVGLCQELCTTAADCIQPGFRCEPLSAEQSVLLGRAGFCMPPDVLCNNGCVDAGDEFCDDGGPESLTSICALGSDCSDCGPRPAATPSL